MASQFVKTLKKHGNPHGGKYWKNPGKIYDAEGDAQRLAKAGLVELVEEAEATSNGEAAE